jgi:hypothetical protein
MGCELLKLINPELQKKDEISKYIDDFHSFFFTTRSKKLVSIDKEEISYPKSSGD